MYLLILGCNVWSLLLLAASAWLGFVGSPHHVVVALFAALFTCLTHGGGVALFLGGGKLVKEHVGRFNLPPSILEDYNQVYKALVHKAILGAACMPVVGVVGGLSGTGLAPPPVHWALALAGLGYLLWLAPHEYRCLKRFHGVVRDVARSLPPPDRLQATAPHPGYTPDEVVMDARGRARALLYIGLSIPVPYLGYRYIVGLQVSWLLLPTIIGAAACLGAAVHYYRRARTAGARSRG